MNNLMTRLVLQNYLRGLLMRKNVLLWLLDSNLLLLFRGFLGMLTQNDLLSRSGHPVNNLKYLLLMLLLLLLLLELLGGCLHSMQRCLLWLLVNQVRLDHLRTIVRHFRVVNMLRLGRLTKCIG